MNRVAFQSVRSRNEIVRTVFEQGWNQQNFAEIADHIAGAVAFNYRGEKVITDLGDLKQLVGLWHNSFSDLRFEVVAVVGEGDLVATNLVLSGTQIEEWNEVPSKGKTFAIGEMMFFRFEGDQIVELWEVIDEHEMVRQLTGEPMEPRSVD